MWLGSAQEKWSKVVGPIERRGTWLLLLLAGGGLLSGALIFVAIGRTLGPIKQLTRSAQRIAEGGFDETINSSSGDEVQTLAEQFNAMAGALKESYTGLEQMVDARTDELREANQTLSALIEASPLAIGVLNRDSKLQSWNKAGERMFGWTEEEALAQPHPILSGEAGRDEALVRQRRILAGESILGLVLHHNKKDGSPIDVEVWAAPLRNPQGDISGGVIIYADITERKAAEEELHRSQKAERELAEVTARLAETGRIVTANLDVAEVYDRFAGEVKQLVDFDRISVNVIDHDAGTFVFRYVSGVIHQGMNASDVLPLKGTATGEAVKTGKTLVQHDVATGGRFYGDQALSDMGFRSSIHIPLKYQGRIIGVLSLRDRDEGMYGPRVQSILEQLADQIAPAVENARLYSESQQTQDDLRQAEQKYRRIFDDSKDPIFITSREGRILDANEAGLDVFGYEARELIGLSVQEMCEDPDCHTSLVAMVNSEGSVKDYEIRLLRKDGSVADCLVSLIAQMDDKNRIVAYQGMVRDITESKLAEEAALEQTREVAVLEERNRMAREIHDTMAQGFTGIVLQMEAAEQSLETSPGALPEHLSSARALARQGLQEARRTVWGLVPQALAQSTLEEALHEEVRRFDAEGQVKITFTQKGKLRELRPDVQTVLLRVCQESLTNIRRHSEATEVKVNLNYNAGEVLLIVEDNGVGFDPPTVDTEKYGTSFGLIGMRQRAEQIKGQIIIDSKKTQGTTVRLSIPIS